VREPRIRVERLRRKLVPSKILKGHTQKNNKKKIKKKMKKNDNNNDDKSTTNNKKPRKKKKETEPLKAKWVKMPPE